MLQENIELVQFKGQSDCVGKEIQWEVTLLHRLPQGVRFKQTRRLSST